MNFKIFLFFATILVAFVSFGEGFALNDDGMLICEKNIFWILQKKTFPIYQETKQQPWRFVPLATGMLVYV